MLKAAAGGGGAGMRLVDGEDKLEAALAGAQREAKAAFGDDTVYLEKAIVRPRHIEIQVFGDEHGDAVHLYERDCSIQRRNQKVIEESPSPAIDDETARADGRGGGAGGAVGRLRRRRHDRDALRRGGAQLLLPGDEHAPAGRAPDHRAGDAASIWCAGRSPSRRASRMPLAQEAIPRRGAAIECRVYAEDPVKFLPSPGTITSLRVPSGPGVRDDSGVVAGSVISRPLRPDDLQAGACGPTRARRRSSGCGARSASTTSAASRRTSPFHRQVMRHPAFIAGDYDTGFIERHKAELAPAAADDETATLAAVAAAAQAADARRRRSTSALDLSQTQPSAWRSDRKD